MKATTMKATTMKATTMKATIAHALLTLALSQATTLAQPRERRADVVEHDFADATRVSGDRHTPWLERLPARIRHRRGSLLRPRTSFVQELRASARNL